MGDSQSDIDLLSLISYDFVRDLLINALSLQLSREARSIAEVADHLAHHAPAHASEQSHRLRGAARMSGKQRFAWVWLSRNTVEKIGFQLSDYASSRIAFI